MGIHQTGYGFAAGGAGTRDGSSAANAGASALQIKQRTGTSTNGLYWVKPPNGSAVQVYCDMNTQGGGWMLIARSHPSAAPTMGTWGWRGIDIGGVSTYTNCYQLNLYSMFQNGFMFYSYLYGNQLRNDTSDWGPFIYQVGFQSANDIFNNNGIMLAPFRDAVKWDTNVYGTTGYPGMQLYHGFATQATSENCYFMRDCCSPTGPGGYGLNPNGMATTYCNVTEPSWYPGPWCGGASLSGNVYIQGGSSSPTNMGGTNQAMIMVR